MVEPSDHVYHIKPLQKYLSRYSDLQIDATAHQNISGFAEMREFGYFLNWLMLSEQYEWSASNRLCLDP